MIKPDVWNHYQLVDISAKYTHLTGENSNVDVVAHRVRGDNAEHKDSVRIAFVYESEEETAAEIVSRCMYRATKEHSTYPLENLYILKLVDSPDYLQVLLAQIDSIKPDVIVVASDDVMRVIRPVSTIWATVDPYQLINRIHDMKWGEDTYSTVFTLSDYYTLLRTKEGKVAKESSTRLGEWVSALVNALRTRNLYTLDFSRYNYLVVNTLDKFEKLLDRMYEAELIGIDTETDNLNRVMNRLATIQFAFDDATAYVLPVFHPESPFTQEEAAYILQELKTYFERAKSATHIYANAKFDIIQLRRECKLQWYNHDVVDVQGALMLLDENRKFRDVKKLYGVTGKDKLSGYALAQLALEYGSTIYLETNMGKDDRSAVFKTPLKDVAEYGGVDVVILQQIYKFQLKEMASRGPAYSRTPVLLLKQIGHMILALVEMEMNGLPVDRMYLTKEVASGGAFIEARNQTKSELYALPAVVETNKRLLKNVGSDLFGRENPDTWVFDIDKIAHQQMLFFDVLGLEPLTYGKDGLPALNKAFKDKYAPLDDGGRLVEEIAIPAVAGFRSYSELKHLYNSFLKGFYNKLHEEEDMRVDSRLRPNFMFLPIVTGRLGARKPSLHQVPSRSKLAKGIKRQFVTAQGRAFVEADFIAHEIKNWMLASKEHVLAGIFKNTLNLRKEFRLLDKIDDPAHWATEFKRLDLHNQSCKLFFGLDPLEVPKAVRTKSKTTTFGTIYGMSSFRLSKALNISEEEAQGLIDKLFATYPDGTLYIHQTHEFGKKYLVVSSGIGRVRHLWGYLHTDFGVHGAMDRRGVNSRIQSVASDEGVEGNYQTQKLRWKLFHSQNLPLVFTLDNMVHDSTTAETALQTIPVAAYLIEHGMTTMVHNAYRDNYGMEFITGLELDFKVGGSLGAMHEWNYRPEVLEDIFEKTVKWQKDEMRYNTPKDVYSKFYDNLDLITEVRNKELRRQPDTGVCTEVLLTRKLAREVAF
jgi:DNA polymerase I-like protein with 3'-5' exonuclease and polymerase domains